MNLANNTNVVFTKNLSGTSFVPSANLSSGRYRIWVRAVSAQGHLSNWSTAVEITVAEAGIEGELRKLETSFLASILPDGESEFDPSKAVSTRRGKSVFANAISAETVSVQVRSEEHPAEAASFTDATDNVMAAWDAADWSSAPTNDNKLRNETI